MRIATIALLLVVALAACETVESPCTRAPAETKGPCLEITVPAATGLVPAIAPPIATYRWRTRDGAIDPDLVRWALVSIEDHDSNWDAALAYLRDHPDAPEWHPWQRYRPYGDSGSGTSWTTPPLSFQHGPFVFVVQGKMADGEVNQDFDLDRNARRVRIPSDIYLTARLTNEFMEPVVASGIWTPSTTVRMPAWTPAVFCWTADPGHDFDDALAYRYGWDIGDLGDDDQWDSDYTSFDGSEACSAARVFGPGHHTFHIEVRNASGFVARIPLTIEFSQNP